MELVKQNQYGLKRAAAIAVLFVGAVGARIFWINQVRAQWGDRLKKTRAGLSKPWQEPRKCV